MTELFSEPEQLKRIAEPLSNRSDIYSLGMTLYVLANDKKFPDQRDVLPEIEEISVELNAILRILSWQSLSERSRTQKRTLEIDDNEILLKGRSRRPFL